MKENPYLIGAGSFLAFTCMLIVSQTILKGTAAFLVSRDSTAAQTAGKSLGAIL